MPNKEINTTFSANLTYWLEKRGKTQADLAKRLCVSTAAVSDWCNENKIPRADKLVEISKWLMIEISDLLQEKNLVVDPMNDIIFKLRDNDDFKELIFSINALSPENFEKVVDYVNLLNK